MLLNKNCNDKTFTQLFGKDVNSLHNGFQKMFLDKSIVLGDNIFLSLEHIAQVYNVIKLVIETLLWFTDLYYPFVLHRK